jgi:membrane protein implicated in regulation of membrane protease activity
VRVGDSDWPARLVGTPPADRKLRVVAVEGTTLLVEAARHL